MMDDVPVRVRDEAAVRRVVLDRPEKVNALTAEMMRAVAGAVGEPAAGTRLVVVSGAGPRGFCAGADLKELSGTEAERHAQTEALVAMIAALAAAPVPVVSVLHGSCLGAGVVLACLSDVAIAASGTRIGFPEMGLGIFPTVVHAALLERVPPSLAMQLCLTGARLDADRAVQAGLVGEVLHDADFAVAAEERIRFYLDRTAALDCARRVARAPHEPDVAARARRAVAWLEENVAARDAATVVPASAPA